MVMNNLELISIVILEGETLFQIAFDGVRLGVRPRIAISAFVPKGTSF